MNFVSLWLNQRFPNGRHLSVVGWHFEEKKGSVLPFILEIGAEALTCWHLNSWMPFAQWRPSVSGPPAGCGGSRQRRLLLAAQVGDQASHLVLRQPPHLGGRREGLGLRAARPSRLPLVGYWKQRWTAAPRSGVSGARSLAQGRASRGVPSAFRGKLLAPARSYRRNRGPRRSAPRWRGACGGAPSTRRLVRTTVVPKLGGRLPPRTPKLAVPPGTNGIVPAPAALALPSITEPRRNRCFSPVRTGSGARRPGAGGRTGGAWRGRLFAARGR